MHRSRRIAVVGMDDVEDSIRALRPRAVVLDVEPYICAWRTDVGSLDAGLAQRLQALAAIESIEGIAVVTNSSRRPSSSPTAEANLIYISSARKPFRHLVRLRQLPRPLVVVGDQVLTDGLLAWRLGGTFVQVPCVGASPAARMQWLLGQWAAPAFFVTEASS